MEATEFTPAMPGKLVPTVGATPDVKLAFVPDPLPPVWEWPTDLWKLLIEARAALSSLDGIGKHLPNPGILLRPLQGREAQLSSQLEGTITDPHQQVLFEADPRYPVSEHDPNNAHREIFNYRQALRRRLDHADSLPLSLRLIKNLHEILMEGVRGAHLRPGEFRSVQNQIGRPARFVPPPPQLMDECLYSLERYLHAEDGTDPLVKAFLAHYQFEAIHPFADGNGRVGRLLLALVIAEWCKLSNQWLYMSAFFERRKHDYMDRLLRISTHGDWRSWIEFCLQGVVEQAKDTEARCDKLLELHRDFHKRVKGGSSRLSGLIDNLFERPVLTVTNVKEKFDVTYPTAKSDLQRLVSMGIIKDLPGTQVATYYCDSIYGVTYEGAQ